MIDKYDVKVFCSNSMSANQNPVARIHNNFVTVIEEELIFPKAIIFVIDGTS